MDRRSFILGALESGLLVTQSNAQSAQTNIASEPKVEKELMHANYIRLFVDDSGTTHFEEVNVDLKQGFAVPPADPLHSAPFLAVTGSYWVGAPTTWRGSAYHPTPKRQIFVTLKGEYQVALKDGITRKFPAGSVLLLEDTTGAGHSTSITGGEDVIIFAVALA